MSPEARTHNPIPRPGWSQRPPTRQRCHRCGERIVRAQVPGTSAEVWVHHVKRNRPNPTKGATR